MPRKTTASAKKPRAAKAAGVVPEKPLKKLNPEVITPVMHSVSNPDDDPEAEVKPKAAVGHINRPYFKGLPILKAYHGRQVKYFIKMCDGMTAWMFQPNGDEESVFQKLMTEPLVAIMVPLAMGEKRGTSVQHAQINGLRMNVMKGRIVHLPETVAKLLEDSQADTAEATSNVEMINPDTGEPVQANLAYRDENELRALTR